MVRPDAIKGNLLAFENSGFNLCNTMDIIVQRFLKSDDFTIGRLSIDDVLECYVLEDEKRDLKVMHETRIPAGRYEIKLRTFGGHHEKYKVRFKDIHKGMLWLQDVPQFKDILIHCGNTDDDTSGCLLVGKTADLLKGTIGQSTAAYSAFYPKVEKELSAGKKVFIEIKDEL
jgi:hypothetical protein